MESKFGIVFVAIFLLTVYTETASAGCSKNGKDTKSILAKTVYFEARGESRNGWRAVAFVIRNRAKLNRSYWGGRSIKRVCLQPSQFECWNPGHDTKVHDEALFKQICKVTDAIYSGKDKKDNTKGSDHYNNPDKEGYPAWTQNVKKTVKIGNHQFYKGP